MLDFLQTYSGVIFFALFFLFMLRMHAGHGGHAGHGTHGRDGAPEPVRVETEDDQTAGAGRGARHTGGH